MTTLLSASSVDFARSVKNSSAVLIVMMLINREHHGHSTTADEIRDIIEMDVRTINNHLRSLSARNLALFDGHGYVLIEQNALILGNQVLAPSPEIQAPQAQAPVLEAGDAGKDTHTACVLLEEEELINPNPLSIDSSSSSMSAKIASDGQPSALQLLEATSVLWHSTMTTSGLESKSRRAIIGWIAQAWDQRKHLRSPQGLIYARLKADQLPQEKYYEHPRQYLPDEYLIAIGLMQPEPEEEIAPEETVEAIEPTQPVSMAPESSTASDMPDAMNHVVLWERVKRQLQLEIPKANFETWVKSTRAVRFDGNVLTVGCLNPYTAEWMTNRQTAAIERLLPGIAGAPVHVIFTVVEAL